MSRDHLIRTYRPFIDGLRAVAILTVVGSHLDLPGFTGGYIGVDIFFVISGCLIIGQIVEDIKKERFQLFDFFARRAFRILPAFLFVMVCCGLLATVVFVQLQTKESGLAFLYTAVMLANHYLLAHQDYFDMAAFTNPLLHMWSLAVEGQFYIVAPLLLIGLSAATSTLRTGTRNMAWTGFALALGASSFAGCVLVTYPPDMPIEWGWEYAHFLQVYEASILTAMGKNRCDEPGSFFVYAHCSRNFTTLSMDRSVLHQIRVRFQPNCWFEGAKN